MKSGIDYFPLDVSLDAKFDLLEAEFGLEGFAAVVKLYQKIYGGEGYYADWDGESALIFARRLGLSLTRVEKLVSSAVGRGFFNKELFERFGILTSRGIQKRYFEIVSRRKEIEVEPEYLLIDPAQICKNADILIKNVDVSPEKVNNYAQNADNRAQSKAKKSKGKQSNQNKTGRVPVLVAGGGQKAAFGGQTPGHDLPKKAKAKNGLPARDKQGRFVSRAGGKDKRPEDGVGDTAFTKGAAEKKKDKERKAVGKKGWQESDGDRGEAKSGVALTVRGKEEALVNKGIAGKGANGGKTAPARDKRGRFVSRAGGKDKRPGDGVGDTAFAKGAAEKKKDKERKAVGKKGWQESDGARGEAKNGVALAGGKGKTRAVEGSDRLRDPHLCLSGDGVLAGRGTSQQDAKSGQNQDVAPICLLWQEAYGLPPTAHVKKELERLLASRGKKELEEAIGIASEHNKVTLAYVKGILKNTAAGTLSPGELAAKKKQESRNQYAWIYEEAFGP